MSKCSSHVLKWKFLMHGAPVLVPVTKDKQALLTVQDNHAGIPQQRSVSSPHTTHKTLGHYKEPAGTQVTPEKNSETYARRTQNSFGHALCREEKRGLITLHVFFRVCAIRYHAPPCLKRHSSRSSGSC